MSDDNPFAAALSRTLKYRPGYPRKPFNSREAARRWVDGFVAWYNDEHPHGGIRYVTPSDGRDVAILAARHRRQEEDPAALHGRYPKLESGRRRSHQPRHP